MASSTPITATKVGRGRRRLGQLWQVPAFIIGALALIGAAASAPWRHTPEWYEFEALTLAIRQGVEHGADGEMLVAKAEKALGQVAKFPNREADANFLAGSAYYWLAQQKPAHAADLWSRAIEKFTKAQELGPSAADLPHLQYRLGFCLYQQGENVVRAIELMAGAVDKGAEQPLQGYQLLLKANLRRVPPNLEGALAASARVLDLTPENNFEAIAEAHIAHAELLVRKEMREEALKELDQISTRASRPLRVKTRLLQARCCEEERLWDRAVSLWQEFLRDADQTDQERARAFYQMGWCFAQMEPKRIAEAAQAWTEALRIGGAAGQAAGLRLGEMRLSLEVEKESVQAIEDWNQAMRSVKSPQDFDNPFIKVDEVRNLFDYALDMFRRQQDPQKAQLVANLYTKIVPTGKAEEKLAAAEEEFARQMQAQKNVAPNLLALQFRRAGEAHEKAAIARPDAERAEPLWRAVQCFLAAKDSEHAKKLLLQIVRFENSSRAPEAWYTLGDLYRAEGLKAPSRQAFVKCLDWPDKGFAYRARYYLAVEEIEKENYEEAKKILEQNLYTTRDGAEIDRASQEKSQFKMAYLLMQMKSYSEARIHLVESIRLYPENPNALLARAQLGECFRFLAVKERDKEEALLNESTATTSDERRQGLKEEAAHHRKTRLTWLKDALDTYQKLEAELEAASARKPLSPNEQLLLRRASFGLGECQYDCEEYQESARVFRRLQQQHRQSLEGFYACRSICHMAEIFRKAPADKSKAYEAAALESLQTVLEDLKAMKPTHEIFTLPGVWTSEQWLTWVEATQAKLVAPRPAERPDVLR